MPLSGKTTVAELMEKKGYSVLDMGEVVRIEMEKRDIETGNESNFVNSMRDKHGMDAIAKLSVPYLEEITREREKVVITGMRSLKEKERFEKEIENSIEVVAVWSCPDTRKKRRKERLRAEDRKGQSFKERDQREIQNGVGELMALSDYLIVNEGELEQLEEEVNRIVS